MCCANTTSTENAKEKARVDPTSREEYGSQGWQSELLRGWRTRTVCSPWLPARPWADGYTCREEVSFPRARLVLSSDRMDYGTWWRAPWPSEGFRGNWLSTCLDVVAGIPAYDRWTRWRLRAFPTIVIADVVTVPPLPVISTDSQVLQLPLSSSPGWTWFYSAREYMNYTKITEVFTFFFFDSFDF